MAASRAQRAKRERDRDAAIALRRNDMSAADVAAVLGCSARKVRELCEGVDLSPPPASDSTAAKKRKPRRKEPAAFKRQRGQPELGRMLRPILLDSPPRPGLGGFGLAPQAVSASGLGPNTPLDGYGDPMGDGRHLKKVGEGIVDTDNDKISICRYFIQAL